MLFIGKRIKVFSIDPSWKIQMKMGFLHVVLIDASNSGPLLEKDISSWNMSVPFCGISSLNPDGVVPSQRLSGSQHCSQISFNKMGTLGLQTPKIG